MTQNPSRRLETLFVSTFNRPPSSHELMLTKQFIEKQRDLHKSEKNLDNMQVTESVWTDLCLATMNSNEYLYVR